MPGQLHRPLSLADIDTHRPTLALPRGTQSGAILHQAEIQGSVSVADVQLACDQALDIWRYQWEIGLAPARKSRGNPSLEVECVIRDLRRALAVHKLFIIGSVMFPCVSIRTHENSVNIRLNLVGYRTNPGFLSLDPSQFVGPRAHWVYPGAGVLAPEGPRAPRPGLLCPRPLAGARAPPLVLFTPGATLCTPGRKCSSFR